MRIVLLASLFLLLPSCGPCEVADLEELARTSAGDGAINCGNVEKGDSPAAVHACIAAEHAAGRAAFALFEAGGATERVIAWSVRADGGVLTLVFDEKPEGGGNPTVDVLRCPDGVGVAGSAQVARGQFFDCNTAEAEAVRVCG